MKKLAFACLLIALVAPVLHAQDSSERAMTSRSQQNIQQNLNRQRQQTYNSLSRADRQVSINAVVNLNKLRDKLAEAWQTLGLSPQAARTVAGAYQPDFALNSRRASLEGKSDQEIAVLIQSALAKKDYLLADQTLIDYQRKQLQLGMDTTPDGQR